MQRQSNREVEFDQGAIEDLGTNWLTARSLDNIPRGDKTKLMLMKNKLVTGRVLDENDTANYKLYTRNYINIEKRKS